MATAQDAGSDQTAQLEEVIVTGSRIKRSEANSASPMTIIEAESIFDSGIANVEDILQEMTASAGPAVLLPSVLEDRSRESEPSNTASPPE